MRAVWVDEGNDPDWDTLKNHSITHVCMSLREPRVTRDYLDNIKIRGYGRVVYVGHRHFDDDGTDPVGYVERVSDRLKEVGIKRPDDPKVQLNPEWHSPGFIQEMVVRWRQLHRYQDTSWTMEGMQGGWMDDEMVQYVKSARIRLVPQCFTGDMRPQAQDMVLRDLIRRDFPESIISLFYDAAALPLNWDGFAFTMGRLPR